MQEKLNYPIKFAIQELTIEGGFTQNYENIILGFIVSKCYVVNENIKYLEDGTNHITYKVVFPYKDIDSFRCSLSKLYNYNEKPAIPKYNYCGECKNANTVTKIFDTYEEAYLDTEIENQNLRKKIPFYNIEEYKNLIMKYNKNLEICKLFEQLILDKTKNMIITKTKTYSKKLSPK